MYTLKNNISLSLCADKFCQNLELVTSRVVHGHTPSRFRNELETNHLLQMVGRFEFYI